MSKSEVIYVTLIGHPMNGWTPEVTLNQEVCLVKEPDNVHDPEAIMVKTTNDNIGHVEQCKDCIRGT